MMSVLSALVSTSFMIVICTDVMLLYGISMQFFLLLRLLVIKNFNNKHNKNY